jgi:hypothetical protein
MGVVIIIIIIIITITIIIIIIRYIVPSSTLPSVRQ